ncbi:MAG: T9SS type A sorting domain-containing protein [Flavobacteriaceae bacterium]|nr:T9SS type A sorting domain-containing protein [Flavobacteriaceae bacterium]
MKAFLSCSSKLKITIIVLFMSVSGYGQPPFLSFFGDSINCSPLTVIPFQDSSLFHVGGIVVPGGELRDSYFAMTDTVGNVKWIRRYDYGVNERVQGVDTDGSHLYVIMYAANVYYTHIAKIAPNGNTVWAYRFLGEFPFILLKTIKVVDDGIVCVGWTRPADYLSEIAVVKLNFDGDILWSSRYTPDFEPASESPYGLTQLSNGDFLITGSTNSFGIGNPTDWGIVPTGFMMRISSSGELIWSKGFRFTRLIRKIIETSTGDFIATGGDWDDERMMVYKISPEGDVLWVKKIYQEEEFNLIRFSDVIETSDNNYLFYGGSEYLDTNVPLMLKMDPDGNMLWHKEQNVFIQYFPGGDIYETSDKGFIGSFPANVDGDQLFGILKTDSMGNSPCVDELLTLEIIDREELIVVDLEFSRSSFEYGKSLSDNGVFIDLDTNGFFCCDSIVAELFFENEGYDYTFGATPGSPASYWWVIEDDTLYGHTVDYTFLGPGEYTICQYADNVCSQDSICETIVVLLDDSGLLDGSISKEMTIYPVPSSNQVAVNLKNYTTKGTLRIFDFAGQLVYQNTEFYGQEIIDLKGFTKGLYFVSVLTETQGVYTGKIIKI